MPAPALKIPVQVNLSEFNRSMDEASSRVQSTSREMGDQFQAVNTKLSSVAAFAAVAAAGTGLVITQLLSAVTSLAKLGDLGESLRLPVNLLHALSVAADQARVPATLLTSALEKFTEVSKGSGDDIKDFNKALGNIGENFVTAFKNAGTQSERLNIISDAFKSTSDEVKRAQLSLQVFGTDNERLIGIFDKGRAGIDDYVKSVFRLGLAIDENFVKQAQQAKSEMALLSRVLTDQFSVSVSGLIPVLTRLLPYLKAIVFAGQAISAIFAEDATAATGALESEFLALNKRIEASIQLKESLAAGERSQADDLRDQIRKFLGIETPSLEDDLKALDKDIADAKKRQEQISAILATRNDQSGITTGPQDDAFKPRPKLDTGSDKVTAFDRALENADKRIAVLNAETDAIGLGTAARERAKLVAELEAAAIVANTRAGEENTAVNDAQRQKINEKADALLLVAKRAEDANAPLARFARESADVSKQLQEAGVSGLRSFEDGLLGVVRGTKTAKQAFSDMANSIINDLIRIAIRSQITGPIAAFLGFSDGGMVGGGGGRRGFLGFSEGGPVRAAIGGTFSGAGTGTSDSIPAMVSNGEFIVRASQAARHRAELEAINSGAIDRSPGAASSATTIVLHAHPRSEQSVRDLMYDLVRVSGDMPVKLKLA